MLTHRAHRGRQPLSSYLHIGLALTGTLHPKFSEDGQAVDFYDKGNIGVLRYAKLKVSDATGRVLPSRFEGIGGQYAYPTASSFDIRHSAFDIPTGGIRIVINAENAVYPITVDPLATSPAWTAEGESAGNWFGASVATAGDVNGDGYSDVIVGVPQYNYQGKVYLYLGSASGLSTLTYWSATGENAFDEFGGVVATAGDVNGDGYSDVIIGAVKCNEGKAYLYLGGVSGLSAAPDWYATGENTADDFGMVATAGDVNGDGYSDVIVGAHRFASVTGKAYLYLGGASGLSAGAAWTAVGEGTSDGFGSRVATAGDVNGDGHSDVIIGAGYRDADTGKAYLYLGSESGLSTVADWTASGEATDNFFGISLATAGDVNGDGYSDIAVGAFGYSGRAGKVYLYLGSAAGLPALADWTATGELAVSHFGRCISTAGDINGDGYSDLVVGAGSYDNERGKAYLFLGSVAGLPALPDWTALGENEHDGFGGAVATAGDVNGDGYSDVIVSAYAYSGGNYTGKAYLYLGSASGLVSAAAWTADGEALDNYFSYPMTTAGDVNGDGYSDVIVAAFGHNSHTGKAYLYLGGAAGLSAAPSWTATGEAADDYFGLAVAPAGDTNGDGYSDVVVGAYCNSSYKGKAYLYLGGSSGLSATASWTATGETAGDCFGLSVSTAGDINGDGYSDVIVGANNNSGGTGKAYLYLGGPSGLSGTPSWTAAGEVAGDFFGQPAARAGDVNGDGYSDVIVGAYGFSSSTGKAYLYLGGSSGLSAAPSWTATGETAGDYFSNSAATAGDVNGDGYSDVIVGAYRYDYFRGKAYLYLGGPSGLSATAAWTALGESIGSYFSQLESLSAAGDVNGDGYSDLVIGAYAYNSIMGRAYLYLGGPSGLSATPSWTADGETYGDGFGSSAGTAGDVNGDGYSDVFVGAYDINGGTGKAYVYLGGGGLGVPIKPRQMQADGMTPISLLGRSASDIFSMNVTGKTPFGRGRVRLEYEVKPLGQLFNGSGTGSTYTWADTGITGTGLLAPALLSPSGPHHWRARLRYNMVKTPWMPGSRWFSIQGNGPQETDLRVLTCVIPDEPCWLYSVTKSGTDYTLNFQDPNQPNQRTGWNIRRSNDPELPKNTWPIVGSNVVDMDAGAANYQWTDHSGADPGPGGVWYYQVTTFNSACPAEGPF